MVASYKSKCVLFSPKQSWQSMYFGHPLGSTENRHDASLLEPASGLRIVKICQLRVARLGIFGFCGLRLGCWMECARIWGRVKLGPGRGRTVGSTKNGLTSLACPPSARLLQQQPAISSSEISSTSGFIWIPSTCTTHLDKKASSPCLHSWGDYAVPWHKDATVS